MKLIDLEMGSTVFKSGVFLAILDTNYSLHYPFLYLLRLIMCESVGKIILQTQLYF